VAWNNPWPGRPDVSYLGINSTTNSFVIPPTSECYRLCLGQEDIPLNIYLGGQDIEATPPTVPYYLNFKIISANCPEGTIMQYNDGTDLVEVGALPFTIPSSFQSGLLHPILFTPAPNTYNAPDPNFEHPFYAGTYTELYCTVVYSVIDENGAESQPQGVDISIQEDNDTPSCATQLPRCSFLEGITNVSGFFYAFTELTMYEDTTLWMYLHFTDVEQDLYIPSIIECNPDNGVFLYDRNNKSAGFYDNEGNILNLASLTSATTTKAVCGPFSDGPQDTFPPSNGPNGVNNKGYYVQFTPNLHEYGNLYNKLGIIIGDNPDNNGQFIVSEYYITVLPVNNAPEIFLTSFDSSSPNPVQATNNTAYEFFTFPGESISPVNYVIDVDTIPNIPSMTVEINVLNGQNADITALDINGDSFSLTTPLRYTGSIFQVNRTLNSLTFNSNSQGTFNIVIYVNDNGATGNCPPGSGQVPNSDGSCPQVAYVTLAMNVANTNSISGPLSIGAGAGVGAFLIGGIIAAVAAIRKFKDKKKESWKEFNEDNFKEYAEANPLYQSRTRSYSNPLYVSSRESEQELSQS